MDVGFLNPMRASLPKRHEACRRGRGKEKDKYDSEEEAKQKRENAVLGVTRDKVMSLSHSI